MTGELWGETCWVNCLLLLHVLREAEVGVEVFVIVIVHVRWRKLLQVILNMWEGVDGLLWCLDLIWERRALLLMLAGVDSTLIWRGVNKELLNWLDGHAEIGKLLGQRVTPGSLSSKCVLESLTALGDIVLLLLKLLSFLALALA